jgi:hypothetical protein
MFKPVVFTVFFILILLKPKAQNITLTPFVVNAGGGTSQNNYFITDWSIGEIALVNQMESDHIIVTNGFLQPFIQEQYTINNWLPFAEEEIRVLPNPVTDIAEIGFRTQQKGRVQYQLFNMQGQILTGREFYSYGYGKIEKINMIGYAEGVYMLRIILLPEKGSVMKKGSVKLLKMR